MNLFSALSAYLRNLVTPVPLVPVVPSGPKLPPIPLESLRIAKRMQRPLQVEFLSYLRCSFARKLKGQGLCRQERRQLARQNVSLAYV